MIHSSDQREPLSVDLLEMMEPCCSGGACVWWGGAWTNKKLDQQEEVGGTTHQPEGTTIEEPAAEEPRSSSIVASSSSSISYVYPAPQHAAPPCACQTGQTRRIIQAPRPTPRLALLLGQEKLKLSLLALCHDQHGFKIDYLISQKWFECFTILISYLLSFDNFHITEILFHLSSFYQFCLERKFIRSLSKYLYCGFFFYSTR